MISKIDHIGILVKDMESSLKKYTSNLGLEVKEIEEVKVEDAMDQLAFLQIGDIDIELIETRARKGFAADFLRDKGEGIHHIAFEVENIDAAFRQLRSRGVEFISDEIKQGSRGSKVVFFKPEEFNGVYIELVQKP